MKWYRWILLAPFLAVMLFSLLPSATRAQIDENITLVRNPNKRQCVTCHSTHGSSNPTLLQVAKNEICESCHDPATGTDPNAPKRLTHFNDNLGSNYAHRIECLDCHNPHYFLANQRGDLGKLPQDPAAEETCQDGIIDNLGAGGEMSSSCADNDGNNPDCSGTNQVPVTICRNFRQIGNSWDSNLVAMNKFMLRTELRRDNDEDCRRNCPTPILTENGLGTFDMTEASDLNTTDDGWETDASVGGATWLQANFQTSGGSNSLLGPREILEVRLHMQGAGYSGIYQIQYSDDGAAWTTVTGMEYSSDGVNWTTGQLDFQPTAVGFNAVRWAQSVSIGARQYWRLLLTNTPGSGPLVSEVTFFSPTDCTMTGGTPDFDTDNFYTGCKRYQVAGRRVATAVGQTDYNDWVSTPGTGGVVGGPPYQGICNVCHTRTQHHRNNNILDPGDHYYTNADHTHNDDRTCTDCHIHDEGFSKGQKSQ
jgi:predicted CXXCH cytochrome family protein